MPLISAVILARSEERLPELALRSLEGLADEVLVLDNESTDGTAAVAEIYGARVLSVPSPPPDQGFDGLRNRALPHLTGEWVFFLDADERVPPRLGPLLRQLVRERGAEFEAVVLPYRHFFCGEWIRHSGSMAGSTWTVGRSSSPPTTPSSPWSTTATGTWSTTWRS